MSSQKLDILDSCQHQRMTIVISSSKFKFTYRFIDFDQKKGLQKFIIHISSRIILNFK